MTVAPFPTTRRSIVLALASDDGEERTRAFGTLVALYWKPLYKFARIAWRRTREDAEDLTQSFFARALEKEALSAYDASKASFRTFLRLLFERFALNEAKASQRLKRGGGELHLDFETVEAELARETSSETPEELFHREWTRSVFALAVERLQSTAAPLDFAIFEAYDLRGDDAVSYRELAARHAVAESTVTNRLAAMRRQLRRIVLDALREATATEHEFQKEARALLGYRG